MIKKVQLKRDNKILDVDYHNYDLISSAILLFVSIKVYDYGLHPLDIYAYSIYIGVYKYIVLHYN